jgi:hypothetical protein
MSKCFPQLQVAMDNSDADTIAMAELAWDLEELEDGSAKN